MRKKSSVVILLFGALALLMVTGCAETKYIPKGKVACPVDITWNVVPQADITSFSCTVTEFKKKPAVVFKVGIKNISDKAQRFRVQIFLLKEGKAVGGLVPRKGKPPVLKPGQEKVVTYPVIKATQLPEKLEVVVKTISLG
ncbi:MAG: hypothetical protein E3J28_00565 [Desulfobacteraceae bacterium]|nr:MAG: hypothetical protein E3J28_00565 [Desulfobacteraceae bacterium]